MTEDVAQLTALLRRALLRINALEARVASLEERQHDLDDMGETVQGIQRLARRAAGTAPLNEGRIRELARTEAANQIAKTRRKNA